MTKEIETWVIINKYTGKQYASRSGKASWRKPAHAKNAFNLDNPEQRDWEDLRDKSCWDLQTDYRLIDVSVNRVIQLESEVAELKFILEDLEK